MTQRLDVLDLLRGISVLGILYMNIYYHAVFEIGYSPLFEAPMSDLVIEVINAFFINICSDQVYMDQQPLHLYTEPVHHLNLPTQHLIFQGVVLQLFRQVF